VATKAVSQHLAPGTFYGETLGRHQAGGFTLSETRYRAASSLPSHSHESGYLGFILKGSYLEKYDGKIRSCEPQMILYHPADELHSQFFDRTTVHLFRVEISFERLNNYDLIIDGRDFRGGLPVALAQNLYREFRHDDPFSDLAIEGLALELLANLARDSRSHESTYPQAWLRRAYELVRSRYLERFTLNEIASEVGVHPVTLAREFRKHYGSTIGHMVRQERIGFACGRLRTSGESLGSIAIAAGFYDQSHFAKVFKQFVGVTPACYRVNSRAR
jgi:AraC family transcriptional regulator